MRAPDDHGDPLADPPVDPPVDPNSSLVNPPADPPADPSAFTPPADQAALDALIKEAVEKAQPQTAEPIVTEALVAPEGFELQPEMANEFLEILNGEMDPKDKANALVALHAKTINAAQEADSTAWENMQTEWKDAVKADPDIGGAKLQPTLNNVGKLLSEFGDDEVKKVFDFTGAGNNVHMIKFLNKIADTLVEGKFFKAGTPGGQDDPNAAAARMFPSMKG